MKCPQCETLCPCEIRVNIPFDQILAVFCEVAPITREELLDRHRPQRVASFRHLAIKLSYALMGVGYMRLKVFWKRDHSTLVYAVHAANQIIATQSGMAEMYREAERRLLATVRPAA